MKSFTCPSISSCNSCIEYDLLIKNKDLNKKTEKIGKRLESFGYKILKNDNFNITFELFSK